MIFIANEIYCLYATFLVSFFGAGIVCIRQDFDTKNIHYQESDRELIYKIYTEAIPLVYLNAFICIPLILVMFQVFCLESLSSFSISHILHLPISLLLIDFTFYAFHYLFHTQKFLGLYRFHKIHHKIKRPVSITSIYLHPIDLFFGNIVPLYLPLILLQTSFPIWLFWTFTTIFETTYFAHSGFKDRCENHDIHHKYFKYNYGSAAYLSDRLFNTYKSE